MKPSRGRAPHLASIAQSLAHMILYAQQHMNSPVPNSRPVKSDVEYCKCEDAPRAG